MPRDRDEPAAVRVYTVCDESKYLVVRNVPSLGCGDELASLFATYGPVEECKPMDAEDCEEYTDVFFIKFSQVSNARFAKRKLDESVFLGNRLQVSYAPQFESLLDTKEKLEVRRKEVLGRIRSSAGSRPKGLSQYSPGQGSSSGNSHHQMSSNKREYTKIIHASDIEDPCFSHVSSNKNAHRARTQHSNSEKDGGAREAAAPRRPSPAATGSPPRFSKLSAATPDSHTPMTLTTPARTTRGEGGQRRGSGWLGELRGIAAVQVPNHPVALPTALCAQYHRSFRACLGDVAL